MSNSLLINKLITNPNILNQLIQPNFYEITASEPLPLIVTSDKSYTLNSLQDGLVLTGINAINGTGNYKSNSIIGNSAANIINGKGGADYMLGGLGNDLYIVDNINDIVFEDSSKLTEIDTIASSVTYTLPENVEILILTGTANINGTGNNINDSIKGNTSNNSLLGGIGNDTLNGGGGRDTLTGGTGDTTFIVNTGISSILDLGDGEDSLTIAKNAIANAIIHSDWTATNNTQNNGTTNIITDGYSVDLTSTIGNNGFKLTNMGRGTFLNGSINADTIIGGTGNDTMNGGYGKNQLTGGSGDTTFIVNNGYSTISDLGNGADSLVVGSSGTAEATLYADWTADTTTSNEGTAQLTTNGFYVDLKETSGHSGFKLRNLSHTATHLTGSSNSDSISCGSGNDTIYGFIGTDTLIGGKGIDSLVISGIDNTDLNIATDTQITKILEINAYNSITANNINLLHQSEGFTILASTHGDTIVGGMGSDNITGSQGIDKITGADGDTLTGGLGSDQFIIITPVSIPYKNAGATSITDLGNGEDTLIVHSNAILNATLTNNWTATADTINEGKVTLTSNGYDVELSNATGGDGYTLINTGTSALLVGSAYADTIIGGKSNDTLEGGASKNILTGGLGNDTFWFNTEMSSGQPNTNTNTITDFNTTTQRDILLFSESIYLSLTPKSTIDQNILSKDFFSGPSTKNTDYGQAYIIYNTKTGILSYDSHDMGSSATIIGTLGIYSHPALAYTDIYILTT